MNALRVASWRFFFMFDYMFGLFYVTEETQQQRRRHLNENGHSNDNRLRNGQLKHRFVKGFALRDQKGKEL